MSKFEEAMELYQSEAEKLSIKIDADLLRAVAKGLGPSIYNKDSSKVSCSDADELGRVKQNFLIKKHGMTDAPALDDAIKAVCEEMGTSNRNKYRAIFYYLLTKKLGLEGNY